MFVLIFDTYQIRQILSAITTQVTGLARAKFCVSETRHIEYDQCNHLCCKIFTFTLPLEDRNFQFSYILRIHLRIPRLSIGKFLVHMIL